VLWTATEPPDGCLPLVHADYYGSKSFVAALAVSTAILVGLSTRLRVHVPAYVREPRLASLVSCEPQHIARARFELESAYRYREYLVDSRVHTPVKQWPRLNARVDLVSTNIRVVRMELARCAVIADILRAPNPSSTP
jgi:hypothetical protein